MWARMKRRFQMVALTARCRGEGEIEVICNGESVGKVDLFEAAEWQEYRSTCCFPKGKTELRFVYHGNGAADLLYLEIA